MPSVLRASVVDRAPACFSDLNLDQVVQAVCERKAEYSLSGWFHFPLGDPDTARFRQDIARDLEKPEIFSVVKEFEGAMRLMRSHLDEASRFHYQRQKEWAHLEAARVYVQACLDLAVRAERAGARSEGLTDVFDYVSALTSSAAFQELALEIRQLFQALDDVRYQLVIQGSSIRVGHETAAVDLRQEVEKTFRRFQSRPEQDYRVEITESQQMNHVEAAVLDLVAALNPGPFALLKNFFADRREFWDAEILVFDREVQFYVSFLEWTAPLREAGLSFCYPEITPDLESNFCNGMFDMALAQSQAARGEPVVVNDFSLSDPERILVVTGPNQGGKTTYARAMGQLYYWAGLGLPVPGREARLLLPDRVFTHFVAEENAPGTSGGLEDELRRFHRLLGSATQRSLVVMNEMFSSTTLADAVFLAREVFRRLLALGCAAVCVTFLDELSRLDEHTVSLVASVDTSPPHRRNFHIERKPADGLAYAMTIAEKYGLTPAQLDRRLP